MQNANSPKHLGVAHQTEARIGAPNKAKRFSNFDNPNFRNYLVDVDVVRYPRESVKTDFGTNNYLHQYEYIKLYYEEYVGEELLTPFIKYPDVKKF